MENRPWLFDAIPGLTSETLLHTSKRSNADAPHEYSFTIGDLVDFIIANYDFSGRQELVVNASGSINIPAGKFLDTFIVVNDNSTQDISIEDTSDPDLIIDAESFSPNTYEVYNVGLYGHTAGKTLNITCVNSITIIYFLR